MILYDTSGTSHTSAQTGIQRVCRALFVELQARTEAMPICYDPHWGSWRPLEASELAVLCDRSGGAGKSRGAKWTLTQKIAGISRRWSGAKPVLPAATGMICPELFSTKVGAHLPELLKMVGGPRVAIFYDAIPLKFPELTPGGTVARFPVYLRELLWFDGVIAISEDSALSLRDYWRWLGIKNPPPVHAIPLGIDRTVLPQENEASPTSALPRILSVGTVEGRKNHLALLEACESLWTEGMGFELQLIGMARGDTAARALARIDALQQAGRPIFFQGSLSESELHAAYRQCRFTVYPSLIEGFGLPVLESLQYGKPCICSGRGALGESARGGGCVTLDSVDASSLAGAIRAFLKNSAELEALSRSARQRKFKSWSEYAGEFVAWMQALSRRD